MSGYHVKHPDSRVDVTLYWAETFLGQGETIVSDQGWSVRPQTPGGVSVDGDSHTATTTTAALTGGRAGDAYLLTSAIVTDQGREIRRSVTVRIANI